MKRALSILLALAMIFSTIGTFPVQASAEELELDAAVEMPFEENQQDITRITKPSSFFPPAVERDDTILSIQDTATFESGNVYQGSYDGITWTLDTGTGVLNISGTGTILRAWYYQGNYLGSYIKSINIGSGITDIGEGAFIECSNLKSIVLPQTIQSVGEAAFAFCESLTSAVIYGEIGESAFYKCISLHTVQIKDSPEMIGDTAFAYCASLSSINIPSSVTSVGQGAFAYCESLENAHISGNLGDAAFACCYTLQNVEIENCVSIGEACFADCSSLSAVTIPNTVSMIHDDAFEKCTSLSEVTLPHKLTSLASHLFAYCGELQTINIPSTVTHINDGAFGMCESLSAVNIPSDCIFLGESAFYGCKSLASIALPDRISEIGNGAFYQCEQLQSITLPRNLKTLGTHAFARCTALQTVNFNSELEQIGEYAFAVCHELMTVRLPDTLQSVGKYAFCNCLKLEEAIIPASVAELPEGVFAQCEALRSVSLPQDLFEIGNGAFFECVSLSEIVLPANLQDIGWAAFSGCKSLTAINIPAGVTRILQATFLNCEKLSNVTIDGNASYIGDNAFSLCSSLEALRLPDTVSEIGKDAFAYCKELKSINFPAALTKIGEGAFFCCSSLENAEIGANVTEIGTDAFSACSSLHSFSVSPANTSFVLEGGALYSADQSRLISVLPTGVTTELMIPDSVTEMGQYAFAEIDGLKTVTLPASVQEIDDLMFLNCKTLETIDIPAGVTRIGAYAFAGCTALKHVGIPESVKEIAEGAFFNCSELPALDIPDSVSAIPHGAFYNCVHLREIALPSNLQLIDSYAFALCSALELDALPQSVSKIGEYAFAGCKALNLSELPDALTELDAGAFAECDSLTSIIIPASVANIDNFVFSNCPTLESVEFKGDIYAVGVGSFYGDKALTNVVFAGNAPELIGENGFAETNQGLTLHFDQAAKGWELPQWTGPDGVTYKTGTVYSGTCGDNVQWRLVTATGDMSIQGSGAMYDWSKPEDTPWHEYADLIRSVTVCEGVSSVGANAFSQCDQLVSVALPSTLTHAGYAAFANCMKLSDVIAEGGLKFVSVCMFYNDDQLWGIELSPELVAVSDYAFYGCCMLGDVNIPASVKRIGEGAFASCVSMEELTFKGKVDVIDTGAFFNCAGLSSIVLDGENPGSVGNYAFYGCSKALTLIGSDDSSWLRTEDDVEISALASSAFSGTVGGLQWSIDLFNNSLTITGSGEMPDFEQGGAPWLSYAHLLDTVIVGEGVTHIGEFAFAEMSSITSIRLPSTLQSIGQYALGGCVGLSALTLPEGLVSLGEGVFSCCASLNELNLPSSIVRIPDYMCSECYSLMTVTTDAQISEVGYGAFYSCENLKSAGFLSDVGAVNGWAFALCFALEESIHSSGAVGEYAFYCCNHVSDVDLSGVNKLGEYAFSQCGLESLMVPGTIQTIPTSAFELCLELKSVVIQSGVESVELDAFYGCQNLAALDLGRVSTLKDHAFMATGLKQVMLPDTLTEYGIGVFADCIYLEMIDAVGLFTSVDGVLYRGTRLMQFPAGKMVGSFTIPAFAEAVADYAFYGCRRLVKINIENNITTLGKASFALCDGLEEASLGSGITELPEAAFGSDGKLSMVLFKGKAPTEIGEDAFYETPETLVLKYFSGADGWTATTWTGPDGVVYHTEELMAGYALKLEKRNAGDEEPKLSLILRSGVEVKTLAIIISAKQGGKTVATQTRILEGIPNREQRFELTLCGNTQAGMMSVEAFLLDAQNGAPLTKSVAGIPIMPKAASATVIQIRDEEASTLLTSSENTTFFASGDGRSASEEGVNTSVVTDWKVFSYYEENTNSFYSDNMNNESETLSGGVSITTTKVHLSFPNERGQDGSMVVETSTGHVRTAINDARAVISDPNGEDGLFYYDVKMDNSIRIKNANGEFRRPVFNLKNDVHIGIGEVKNTWKKNTLKFVLAFKGDIIHTTINASNDEELSLDISGNIGENDIRFTIIDEGETEPMFDIGITAGIGSYRDLNPSIPVGKYPLKITLKSISKDKISLGIGFSLKGTGKGFKWAEKFAKWVDDHLKLEADFTYNHGAIKKYIEKHFDEFKMTQYLKAQIHTLEVYVADATKEADRIVYLAYVTDAENSITDAWVMPNYYAWYLPGEDVYNQALPKSAGGTTIPTISTQTTGGGAVSTTVPTNGLTQAQQQAINESIVAQTVVSVIPQTVTDQIVGDYIGNTTTPSIQYDVYGRIVPQIYNFGGDIYIGYNMM